MVTVLVTGANRGLGLEFVSHYLDRGNHVIATYRDIASSTELIKMSEDSEESYFDQEYSEWQPSHP